MIRETIGGISLKSVPGLKGGLQVPAGFLHCPA
jgi:hypothetical protein